MRKNIRAGKAGPVPAKKGGYNGLLSIKKIVIMPKGTIYKYIK